MSIESDIDPTQVQHTVDAVPSPDVPSQALEQSSVLPLKELMAAFHDAEPRVGRFVLETEIGKSTHAVTYRAQDPILKRTVAVKICQPETMTSPEIISQFQRETTAAAELLHPNIAPIFDSGCDCGRYYVASAYVWGNTLQQRLGSGLMPLPEVVAVVRKLAEALHHAHQQGVVHRDIRPAKVMLRENGEPVILDFGFAAREDWARISPEGQMLSTPMYLAPEHWEGKPGAASDQYSLGCVLYELLTAKTIFPDDAQPLAWYARHTKEQPLSPLVHRPDLPADLVAICMKCLAKNPAERYSNCQALADDLRRWTEDEPVAARQTSIVEQCTRTFRKNRNLCTVVLAVFLVLLSGVLLAGWLARLALGETDLAKTQAKASEAARLTATTEKNRAEAAEKEAKHHSQRAENEARHARAEATSATFQQRRAEGSLHALQLESALSALRSQQDQTASELLQRPLTPLHSSLEQRFVADWLQRRSPARTISEVAEVRAVAVSREGDKILVGDASNMVSIYELATGEVKGQYLGHRDPIRAVAFRPGGKHVASASGDKTVKVWDIATGRLISSILSRNTGPVECVAFSVDGKRLFLAGFDKTVIQTDPDTARDIRYYVGHTATVTGIAVHPDGKRVITCSKDRTVKIWDIEQGTLIQSITGHVETINAVALSPNGKTIISVGGSTNQPGEICLWDMETGREVLRWRGHNSDVTSVSFSVDGKQIFTSSRDGSLRTWDASTGDETLRVQGHKNAAHGIVAHPNGQQMISVGADRQVKVWNCNSELAARTYASHRQKVECVAIHPDSRHVASASKEGIHIRETFSGREGSVLKGHKAAVTALVYAPEGRHLVSGSADATIRVWSTSDWSSKVLLGHARTVGAVAFSPDGTRFVSVGHDGCVFVWDTKSGERLFPMTGHTAAVKCVAISRDGRKVVTGGADKTIRVWDASNGKELLCVKGHTMEVNSVTFVNGGERIASASDDRTLRIWNANTGEEVQQLKGHTDLVHALIAHPDDRSLISASFDKTIRLWDANLGVEKLTLTGHSDRVTCLSLSKDGNRLVSGSSDWTVKLWTATPIQPKSGPSAVAETRERIHLEPVPK
jgi:WD40 repeat protein